MRVVQHRSNIGQDGFRVVFVLPFDDVAHFHVIVRLNELANIILEYVIELIGYCLLVYVIVL